MAARKACWSKACQKPSLTVARGAGVTSMSINATHFGNDTRFANDYRDPSNRHAEPNTAIISAMGISLLMSCCICL